MSIYSQFDILIMDPSFPGPDFSSEWEMIWSLFNVIVLILKETEL